MSDLTAASSPQMPAYCCWRPSSSGSRFAERLAACIEDPRDPDRVLRHVIRRIRARWPKVEIIVRGDSHYGRPEAMAWCERNRVGYIFGLGGNPPRPTRRYTIRIISRIPPMPIPPR
jgi:hypothetical protein